MYFLELKDLRSISTKASNLDATARRHTATVGAQSSDRPSQDRHDQSGVMRCLRFSPCAYRDKLSTSSSSAPIIGSEIGK